MTKSPRASLSLAFPGKGSATPIADVAIDNTTVAARENAPEETEQQASNERGTRGLPPKQENGYAALTIRPGPARRKRLKKLSQTTGHSMQDILLHCFDVVYPP